MGNWLFEIPLVDQATFAQTPTIDELGKSADGVLVVAWGLEALIVLGVVSALAFFAFWLRERVWRRPCLPLLETDHTKPFTLVEPSNDGEARRPSRRDAIVEGHAPAPGRLLHRVQRGAPFVLRRRWR